MMSRRRFLLASATAMAATACATPTPSGVSAPTGLPVLTPSSRSGLSGALTPILAATDLAVGPNQRFLLAILGTDNRPITDARVELAFFKVTGQNAAQLRDRTEGVYRESPGAPDRGVYVARTTFDEPGEWGIAAQVQRPGGVATEVRAGFQVRERSVTPAIGAPVPRSMTLTGTSAAEIERFCSARPADDFHRVSIAEATGTGKPLVVLFASPSFCTSRTCGPSLEVLSALSGTFGGRALYVHVEIYKDGHPGERGETVPAVAEWGLPSEPWLFIVGGDGRLADKFEGSITRDEVEPALQSLLD